MTSIEGLVELGDPDELIREIGRRCYQGDWDGLFELRTRCRLAVERGKQLWGVAAHAEYRLALEGPAELAAEVLDSNTGPFVLGPLPEVAASTHSWADLRDFLPDGPLEGVTAYERVVRGEALEEDDSLAHQRAMFEMPLALQPWEPAYSLGEYLPNEARFPHPDVNVVQERPVSRVDYDEIDDPVVTDALRGLVHTWTTTSNGSARIVAVDGALNEALSAAGAGVNVANEIDASSALAMMAWAGASGGAHGRRNGAAAGRSKAWWALAAIAGVSESWPLAPEQLGEDAKQLSWWTWSSKWDSGWQIRLAVVDPVDEVAFALSADDAVERSDAGS